MSAVCRQCAKGGSFVPLLGEAPAASPCGCGPLRSIACLLYSNHEIQLGRSLRRGSTWRLSFPWQRSATNRRAGSGLAFLPSPRSSIRFSASPSGATGRSCFLSSRRSWHCRPVLPTAVSGRSRPRWRSSPSSRAFSSYRVSSHARFATPRRVTKGGTRVVRKRVARFVAGALVYLALGVVWLYGFLDQGRVRREVTARTGRSSRSCLLASTWPSAG